MEREGGRGGKGGAVSGCWARIVFLFGYGCCCEVFGSCRDGGDFSLGEVGEVVGLGVALRCVALRCVRSFVAGGRKGRTPPSSFSLDPACRCKVPIHRPSTLPRQSPSLTSHGERTRGGGRDAAYMCEEKGDLLGLWRRRRNVVAVQPGRGFFLSRGCRSPWGFRWSLLILLDSLCPFYPYPSLFSFCETT
jgi:hypothetical protein